jgi:hypothetical protein
LGHEWWSLLYFHASDEWYLLVLYNITREKLNEGQSCNQINYYYSTHELGVLGHAEAQVASSKILLFHELRWVLRSLRTSFPSLQVPFPLPRPQDDPVEDIPLFDLESSLVFESDSGKPAVAFALEPLKI